MTGSSCSVFTEVCSPVQKLKSLQYPHYSDDMENTPTLFPDSIIEVAEHSFQVPMLNSPLLLNYLCFGARFLQESRLTTEGFILAFWLGCVMLPWQRSWLKTRLKNGFCLFKKIQLLDFFHHLPTTN